MHDGVRCESETITIVMGRAVATFCTCISLERPMEMDGVRATIWLTKPSRKPQTSCLILTPIPSVWQRRNRCGCNSQIANDLGTGWLRCQ